MNAAVCPDAFDLAGLLEQDGEGGPEFFEHLEGCAHCQQTLAELAADEAGWQELDRLLPRSATGCRVWPPSSEPALERAIDQFKTELPLLLRNGPAACHDEDLSLSILRPVDRPGMLGYLGAYEVREVIGRGGMGVVFEAFDPALQRRVAIKVIAAAALAGSATARLRFIREAKAAAAVIHENVVTVHGVLEEAGLPYLVMQYIAGESLQARLDREGPLEVEEIIHIGLQTARGLAAAHALGLVYRDIKPANLLLSFSRDAESSERSAPSATRLALRSEDFASRLNEGRRPPTLRSEDSASRLNGVVKITDFGLARMADDASLTRDGVIAGTPEYMAPEQAALQPIDHRADLFSLGSVLYACCTGRPPFRGSSAVEVLRQVSEEEPVSIRSLNPNVPAWLDALIARLMAKNSADRFQSAAEVVARLEGPRTLPTQSQTVGRSAWRGWLVTAMVVLVALGMARWLLSPNAPGPAEATSNEFYQDFRGSDRLDPSLKLMGHDLDQVFKHEAEGLRITLPGVRSVHHPVELATTFALSGDFEITGSFELLSAQQPVTGYGVGVSLNIADSEARIRFAKIARAKLVGRGSVFHSECWVTGQKGSFQIKSKPTEARLGQLRLVRKGPSLRYLAAEGLNGDFQEIFVQPKFGTQDMANVRFVVADSGAAGNPVDVRLIDLRIRSGNLATIQAAPGSPDSPADAGGSWLPVALVFGLLLTLCLGVGVWLRMRRRRSAGPESIVAVATLIAQSVSTECPGCGTKLKGSAALAGKKVKCPRCGKAVQLEGPPATEAPVVQGSASPAKPASGKKTVLLLLLWASTALLAVSGLGLVILYFLPAPSRSAEPPSELSHDFRGGKPLPSFLTLQGPDADELIKPENEGLRMTLPAVREQTWAPVGVASLFRLSGDFEVTATYELFSADPPRKGHGAGIALNVADTDSVNKLGKVGRFRRVIEGDAYVSEYFPRDSSGEYHLKCTPTTATAGQLRLVRNGSTLHCLVKEAGDSDFREIDRLAFTDEEMNLVRFVVNNNGSPSRVDARLLDLTIRGTPMKPVASTGFSQQWLLLALILGGVSSLPLLLALGLWLGRRRAREVTVAAC